MNSTDLKIAIRQAENKQSEEWVLLNEQLLIVRDSLHPLQILKRSFNEVVSSSTEKNNLLGTVMGLTAGVISKALVVGATHNPIKVLFGALLQMKVSNSVAKNAGTLGFIASNLIGFFNKRKESRTEPIHIPSNPLREIF